MGRLGFAITHSVSGVAWIMIGRTDGEMERRRLSILGGR